MVSSQRRLLALALVAGCATLGAGAVTELSAAPSAVGSPARDKPASRSEDRLADPYPYVGPDGRIHLCVAKPKRNGAARVVPARSFCHPVHEWYLVLEPGGSETTSWSAVAGSSASSWSAPAGPPGEDGEPGPPGPPGP
ncbi:MAG: hypothetical protein RMM28_08385, partial [Thermoleophilia bacterium]|nr:hypothetical protein [Thermoleophilia bacterium]